MNNVRLFGLVLIVTTLLLALAAVATQTAEIRFERHSAGALKQIASKNSDMQTGRPVGDVEPTAPSQFISVPVIVPLGAAGMLGLLFWFTPATATAKSIGGRPRRSRRRR
ncbi:MAG: hypothetical protein KF752_17020 [Pirellulaceae bacterium]|nr:hypothetical protein [Pirellulaceae bacterium]